jgi:RND family efflux transporter MFP subunit
MSLLTAFFTVAAIYCGRLTQLLILLFAILNTSVLAQDSVLETAAAMRQELETVRVFDGVVEPVNIATVSAQTSGQITEVNYDVNDFVAKDSVIVRVREIQQSAQVAQAEADLRAAKAHRLEAGENFKRAQDLFSTKSISKANFDSARAAMDTSKAQLDAAQAALAQAQELLDYTVVRAPFAGVVTARHVEIGETVSPGQPLMTGFSLDQLRVRVEVPQSMIEPIRQLGTARVITHNGIRSLTAESLTIFPYANTGSNTFTVRIKLPDKSDNLYPGMLTKIAFVTGKKSSLVIPQSAVVQRSEVTGAYIIDAIGNIQLRQLRIGRKTVDGGIEVLAGLKEGEQVVVDPVLATVALNGKDHSL